jgi:cytochrome P450
MAALYDIADYRRLARTGRRKASEAIFELVRELRPIVSSSQANGSPRPSFLSELASSNPRAIASDEIMCNFAYTFHIARLDVHGLLMWLLVTTLRNGAWLDRLAEDIGQDRAAALRTGGLADRIVRETLRLHQSEFLLRRVQHPISWNGFRIPAGWFVRICVQESHRSSELFDRPDVFDPDRFLQPPNRTRYSPFGMAPRLCPGEHLARAVGRHLVAELVTSRDLKVRGVEPLEFSGFHWRPGANLRVTADASG